MDITAIAGIGILSAVLCVIVRQYKPEMALGISTACGILILTAAITMLAPSVSAIAELTEAAGLDEGYAAILLKALAVCYITQLAADCCRDAGESAIAGKIELAGKSAIVVISLPVFASLAELVTNLIKTV
ncbi:MAG: stage III sporulation protein AC/AD protein family [Ruminococcaceae bacterium]|nr:stage III sporulation protein AC/AD protein family [Oscillospiraceae bacterium]